MNLSTIEKKNTGGIGGQHLTFFDKENITFSNQNDYDEWIWLIFANTVADLFVDDPLEG